MKPDDLPDTLLRDALDPTRARPSAPPADGEVRAPGTVLRAPGAPAVAPANGTGNRVAVPSTAPILFELQALALREPDFDAAATTVLSTLCARLGASRLSLASRAGARRSARVLASSDGVDADRRLPAMRALMNAADEVLDRSDLAEAPLAPGGQGVPSVALSALLRGDEVRSVIGVPFDTHDGQRAALLAELRHPATPGHRLLLRDIALFVGPILMLKAQLSGSWWARLGLTDGVPAQVRRRRRIAAAAGGLAVAGALTATLWPSTQHVVAQARIEGQGQRLVPAPMDGFLQAVLVRPGEAVREGQVLATLDDKDAQLQAERTAAERRQYERQYLDALTREDAAATEIARSKLEQARAQDELAQSRLALSRIAAPFDGVVISGDLLSQVGSPVKRGQELMVVAPSNTWRVVAEVDEADIELVATGQPARVLLSALADRSAEFTVTRVSPVAQPVDGRNVFEVEGLLQAGSDPALRPGLRGVARIEAGERAPLLVWWDRLSRAVRRVLWTLMA